MSQLSDVKLIIYDFDGVMTDNTVVVNQDGSESVVCNRADGLGVDIIRSFGIAQAIISSERNPVVAARAKKLNLPVFSPCVDKKLTTVDYAKNLGVDLFNIAFVGNDINDLSAMRIVGIPIAPSDAFEDIKLIAKLVLKSKGGQGVVRELAQILSLNVQTSHN